MTKPVCPHDGTAMHRDTRPLTLTYKGVTATAPGVPGWYCKKCDEAIFDPKDAQKVSRIMNSLRAGIFGLFKPEEIRRIRKNLGLSQEKAGLLIGGGPRAFQKYESGDLLPSQGVNNLLKVLDHSPAELAVLEADFRKKAHKFYGGDDRPSA